MSDVFKIDWIQQMKTNDVANGIGHTGYTGDVIVDKVNKWSYWANHHVIESEKYSTMKEAYTKFPDDISTKEGSKKIDDEKFTTGILIHNVRYGKPYYEAKPFNLFAYKTPPSIYNLHQPSLR